MVNELREEAATGNEITRRMKLEKQRFTGRERFEGGIWGWLPKVDLFDGSLRGMYLEPVIVRDRHKESHDRLRRDSIRPGTWNHLPAQIHRVLNPLIGRSVTRYSVGTRSRCRRCRFFPSSSNFRFADKPGVDRIWSTQARLSVLVSN